MADAGVQRYGFRGLSYEFIARRLRSIDAAIAQGRVMMAHLGNGASLGAMRDGKSVDTTMGFTTLDGLLMGTRPGTLDPGAVTYLMRQHAMTAAEVEDVGVLIDEDANRGGRERIEAKPSRVATYVVPTDEDRMIAAHTAKALAHAPGASERAASRRSDLYQRVSCRQGNAVGGAFTSSARGSMGRIAFITRRPCLDPGGSA